MRSMHSVQRGSTLIVVLVILVMLTVMSLSAMHTTMNINQVVANSQFREEAMAAGQQMIEQVISTISSSKDPVAAAMAIGSVNVDINQDGSGDYLTKVYSTSPSIVPACIKKEDVPTDGTEFRSYLDSYGRRAKDQTLSAAERAAAKDKYENLYQCVGTVSCFWSVWDVPVMVTDGYSGTSTQIHQGVRVFTSTKTVSNYCSS